MSDLQSIITVINPVDGKRYKMNLKGDVSRVTVRKLKKYLEPSCGIEPENQLLKYNGVELGDEVYCAEVGISNGSTLVVERRTSQAHPFIGSPQRHALEMETLDQQRAMLQTERIRRDEEFKRQQQSLAVSIAQAEKRRLDLERERQEKEFELKRVAEMETAAEAERQRVASVRAAESEREAIRARDLEARKSQLFAERNAQRQLEIQKLENERKKMLLAQQKAEYESERQRLERERREHHERRLRHELEIREKEIELERQRLEGDRQRKELEMERMIANQQRAAEFTRAYGHIPQDNQFFGATPHESTVSNSLQDAPSFGQTPRAGTLAEKQAELDRLRAQRQDLENHNSHNTAGNKAPNYRQPSLQSTEYTPQGPQEMRTYSQPHHHHHPVDPQQMAAENLDLLAHDLGLPGLSLDASNTCSVNIDDTFSLLVTYDQEAKSLFLYSTLTTVIPKDPTIKLRLYEFLLEGALLGRDMCGGGVGASMKNQFILMSTTIFLPTAQPNSLQTMVPRFLASLKEWRKRVSDFLHSLDVMTVESVTDRAPESELPEYPMVGIEVTDGVIINGVHTTYADGVVVVNVSGPAQRAGILPNDFIRLVDGRRVSSLKEFQEVIRGLLPHSQVPFMVDRAGAHLVVNVLVGSTTVRPGDGKYKNRVRVGGQ